MRELLRQFRIQLRRHHLQKIGIVGQERLRQVLACGRRSMFCRAPNFTGHSKWSHTVGGSIQGAGIPRASD